MGSLGDKPDHDYESLRDARISENIARMETLGLRRRAGELRAIAAAARRGSDKPRKPWTRRPRALTLRRSARLNGEPVEHQALPFRGALGKVVAGVPVAAKEDDEEEEDEEDLVGLAVAAAATATMEEEEEPEKKAVFSAEVSK